jgi:hypothetical protein
LHCSAPMRTKLDGIYSDVLGPGTKERINSGQRYISISEVLRKCSRVEEGGGYEVVRGRKILCEAAPVRHFAGNPAPLSVDAFVTFRPAPLRFSKSYAYSTTTLPVIFG